MSDSDTIGDAIAKCAADAQFDAFTDALAESDPIAYAICDLINSVAHESHAKPDPFCYICASASG